MREWATEQLIDAVNSRGQADEGRRRSQALRESSNEAYQEAFGEEAFEEKERYRRRLRSRSSKKKCAR